MHGVYLCVHTGYNMPEEIRGQLCGADSLLLAGVQG